MRIDRRHAKPDFFAARQFPDVMGLPHTIIHRRPMPHRPVPAHLNDEHAPAHGPFPSQPHQAFIIRAHRPQESRHARHADGLPVFHNVQSRCHQRGAFAIGQHHKMVGGARGLVAHFPHGSSAMRHRSQRNGKSGSTSCTAAVKTLEAAPREGQLWLIPDKSSTTKEPILVTVAGAGVTVERFDHPDQRKQLDKADANTAFQSYLREAKALDQYVVFLVRPSGIETFQDLVKSARDMGFDALEEDRQIHFSTPPAVDESTPTTDTPANAPTQNTSAPSGNSVSPANAAPAATPPEPNTPQPAATPSTPTPPKDKSWWQKMLEWAGLG
jgi:hypothetical protein